MEKTDILIDFIKMLFINICLTYISFRIIDYKLETLSKKIIISITTITISIIYSILVTYINPINFLIFLYLCFSIIIGKVMNIDFKKSIIITAVAISFTYVLYIISIIIGGIILYLLKISQNYSNKNNFIVIAAIEILLINLLFRNKRFKHGIYFLKNDNKYINIFSYITIVSIIIVYVYNLLHIYVNVTVNTILFVIIVFIGISLIIWTQNQITKQYKRNMRDRTIEIQTKEIVEQSKIIKEIKEENLKLAETIHKYNNRLSALELGIANALKTNNKTEFANELGLMLEETKELSKNFAEETTINKTNLPKTNIIGLDNMFKYFQNEANKNNIDFNVIINENIEDLLKIIDKPKLETLIGDHLKDAIIAVNKSKNPYKSILVILGISNKCYEISICDSGIEFEIDTLLKLGKERVTTHKEEGGSGIGFITTFKTLKETKASLEIEEYNPKTTNYTKSIIIRFDGKNEYRIYSYRAEEIKKKNNEKRIIIEEL